MSLGRTVKRWVTDHGQESALARVTEAFEQGKISDTQFSLRDLAENIVGPDWADKLQTYAGNPNGPTHRPELYRGSENADAVDASTFSEITGNRLITTIREKYNSPEFIGNQLVTTIPVENGNLDTQREPWLSNVSTAGDLFKIGADDEDIINPGMPIRSRGFSPNYIVLDRPRKRGQRCDVTWEMIYADRTRQARESAASVGQSIRLNKEYRIMKMISGLGVSYTYSFGGAAEYTSPTYVETAGGGNGGARWTNHLDSTPLQSWSDLNAVEKLFNEMRDPVTNEPIEVGANTLLVMPSNVHNARHILFSTGIRVGPGGSTSNQTVTYSGSDLKPYEVMTSKHLYKLMSTSGVAFPSQDYTDDATTLTLTAAQAADFWWVGNFPKAFYYREVYPLRTDVAPPLNPDDFGKDIVLSVRALEFGVAGVRDPRYVVRCAGHNFESQSD